MLFIRNIFKIIKKKLIFFFILLNRFWVDVNKKKVGVEILILDKIKFKIKCNK